mmetsp:Transcript_32426/g.64283  ORF Transcript_32426/g.64283 Transcript_32426/m.64283 type:complete len:143 (+) Transcript_32426:267-695(+)
MIYCINIFELTLLGPKFPYLSKTEYLLRNMSTMNYLFLFLLVVRGRANLVLKFVHNFCKSPLQAPAYKYHHKHPLRRKDNARTEIVAPLESCIFQNLVCDRHRRDNPRSRLLRQGSKLVHPGQYIAENQLFGNPTRILYVSP